MDNAEDALSLLETGSIKLAFFDVNGIEKNGIDVHDLIRCCYEKDISFCITSNALWSRRQLAKRYPGIRFADKWEAARVVYTLRENQRILGELDEKPIKI